MLKFSLNPRGIKYRRHVAIWKHSETGSGVQCDFLFYFLGDLLSRRHVALSSKPTVHILIYFALTDVLHSCVVVVGRGGETVRERERERDRWLRSIVIRARHCAGLVLEEYGLQKAQDRTASGRGHRGRYRGFAQEMWPRLPGVRKDSNSLLRDGTEIRMC